MILGIPAARKRGLLLPLGGLALLFLLVAWGGHSPFYRLWYLLPKMGQFRAPGLAFYMVALVACVLAGFGVDRLLSGEVKRGVRLHVSACSAASRCLPAPDCCRASPSHWRDSTVRRSVVSQRPGAAGRRPPAAGGRARGRRRALPGATQDRAAALAGSRCCCSWWSAATTGRSFASFPAVAAAGVEYFRR